MGFNVSFQTVHWTRRGHASVTVGVCFYLVERSRSARRKEPRRAWNYLHGIALPEFYIVSSFFYKKSKQARVPTFVLLFCDDATSAKRPGCDEGTNLRLRDFAVVPLMPTLDDTCGCQTMYRNYRQHTEPAT